MSCLSLLTSRVFLEKLGLTDYFSVCAWGTGSKVSHFETIKQAVGVEYGEMVFFDDEARSNSKCNAVKRNDGITNLLDLIVVFFFPKALDFFFFQEHPRHICTGGLLPIGTQHSRQLLLHESWPVDEFPELLSCPMQVEDGLTWDVLNSTLLAFDKAKSER